MRAADHRASINDVPVVGRVSVEAAVAELEAGGLAADGADDLEVYRLVMSPAQFKRLQNRLATLRLQAEPQLPFGADVEADWKRERLEAWAYRPNGEPLPSSWSPRTEVRLPGRLKLVPGREFTVSGIRGRLRFRHGIVTDNGEFWLDGWDSEGRCRSVHPDRVRTVHRKSKTRPPLVRLRGG
jgi:hypothetical protein